MNLQANKHVSSTAPPCRPQFESHLPTHLASARVLFFQVKINIWFSSKNIFALLQNRFNITHRHYAWRDKEPWERSERHRNTRYMPEGTRSPEETFGIHKHTRTHTHTHPHPHTQQAWGDKEPWEMKVFIHVCMYKHKCTYTYIHTYTYMHTDTQPEGTRNPWDWGSWARCRSLRANSNPAFRI